LQILFQSSKSPRTVAQAVLDLQGQLRRGQAKLRHVKYGIIAETALPQGPLADLPLPAPLESLEGAVGPAENQNTAECRTPLFRGNASKRLQKLPVVLLVGGVLACVTGRKNARAPIQGIHFDPRIVGKGRLPGEFADGPGLFQGIVQKGETVLPDLRNIRVIV